ncbi:MAG: hypothetical protein IPG92_09490 [Flavobacteriales bacterium]|nr:hypothetical protein [Flavobacteriales bacterium]
MEQQHGNPMRIALIMAKGLVRDALALCIQSTTPHQLVLVVADGPAYEEACTILLAAGPGTGGPDPAPAGRDSHH